MIEILQPNSRRQIAEIPLASSVALTQWVSLASNLWSTSDYGFQLANDFTLLMN